MKKIVIKIGLVFIVINMILGCYFFYNYTSTPIFGGELLDYELLERTENKWMITVAAKPKWMDKISDINIFFDRGSAEYDYIIEKSNENFGGYSLYHIIINTYNYDFKGEKYISIERIEIVSNENTYNFKPKKIKFIQYDWSKLNHDELYFSSSPLNIPYEMCELPIRLSVENENEVYLKEVILTNKSFSRYSLEGNKEHLMELEAGTYEEAYSINFEETPMNKYIQYYTDICILYEVQGEEYELIPEICTVYNQIDKDKLIKYFFNEILF